MWMNPKTLKRSLRLILLIGIALVLFGAVAFVAAAAICSYQLPEIALTDSIANFAGNANPQASELVARADAFVRHQASPLVVVGSGITLTSAFDCESDSCELTRVIVEFGMEPRIRCFGIHTPVKSVQFDFHPHEDRVEIETYRLDGGHTIASTEFISTSPSIETALEAALQQFPHEQMQGEYEATVTLFRPSDSWKVRFRNVGSDVAFAEVDIPMTGSG
jgi:hypothetical protein